MEELKNELMEDGFTSDSLEGWIIDRVSKWKDHYDMNYRDKHDEYYRIWRGIWDARDKTRDSERSKIIAPATQQAVESNVAEIEEATFGRGRWFDIRDENGDNEALDVMFLRKRLAEDFEKTKIRQAVGTALLNAAVYGTGIAEVVLEEVKEMAPATQPVLEGQLEAIGVTVRDRTVVKLRPIQAGNFFIDPAAPSIEEALGVAIVEFVPRHQVELLQEKGVYKDEYVGTASADSDFEPDDENVDYDDKIKLTKYFGLVPSYLLEDSEDFEDLGTSEDSDLYVEAIVVLGNDVLLKAERNPYMMQDRPVVAFPWDTVPGRFWGRGVCEKGYNSQKALDAELRARIDALALTVHPMLAMDATRLPRGAKPEVRPGKLFLTNGNPNEIIVPFHFGNVDQIQFTQAAALQTMVQQATGAVDSTGITGAVNGEGTAAGISMSLGAIIKRHKRTLINFQECFLMPFVAKAAWRYMQFDPENYPVKDYKFLPTSSLGIIAREYEVTQLTQLLQTMSPDSPLYPVLIQNIVDNMNLSNREELMEFLKKASQPSPEQQQAAQKMQQLQEANLMADLELKRTQAATVNKQGMEFEARSKKLIEEAKVVWKELEIEKLKAVAASKPEPGNQDDAEFTKRLKIADFALKEKEMMERMDLERQKWKDEQARKEREAAFTLKLKERALQGQPNGSGNA